MCWFTLRKVTSLTLDACDTSDNVPDTCLKKISIWDNFDHHYCPNLPRSLSWVGVGARLSLLLPCRILLNFHSKEYYPGVERKKLQSANIAKCMQHRGLSHQFFVQISAQNLSQILNVLSKSLDKTNPKKRAFATKIRFATKARICPIAAWTSNNS